MIICTPNTADRHQESWKWSSPANSDKTWPEFMTDEFYIQLCYILVGLLLYRVSNVKYQSVPYHVLVAINGNVLRPRIHVGQMRRNVWHWVVITVCGTGPIQTVCMQATTPAKETISTSIVHQQWGSTSLNNPNLIILYCYIVHLFSLHICADMHCIV